MSLGTILSMRRPTRSKSQSLKRSNVRAKATKKVKEKPPWDVSFFEEYKSLTSFTKVLTVFTRTRTFLNSHFVVKKKVFAQKSNYSSFIFSEELLLSAYTPKLGIKVESLSLMSKAL